MQCREIVGKDPDMVVCTNAGGGMMTGTARGLLKAGCVDTQMVSASIDPVSYTHLDVYKRQALDVSAAIWQHLSP